MTGTEAMRPGPGNGPGASLASAEAASSTAAAPPGADLVLVSLILAAFADVFLKFLRQHEEERLLAGYRYADTA